MPDILLVFWARGGNEDGVRKDDKIQGLVRAMIEIRLY